MIRSHACRPLDQNRDGFVIGEGGGALLLETEEHAQARGAHDSCGAGGMGEYVGRASRYRPLPGWCRRGCHMQRALKRAGMQPSDIGYINAHGTSTLLGDKAETLAVKSVFGGREAAPPVSSTKSATGHLMGAGGLTEAIACIKGNPRGHFATHPTFGCS